MKKSKLLITSLSFMLVLAACGQGEENGETTPIDNTGGTEVTDQNNADENNENDENEAEQDANNENNEANSDENEAEQDANNENNEANSDENEAAEATIDGVVLYFSDDQLMNMYRVHTDVTVAANEQGAKEAYELWIAGPSNENLVGLIPDEIQVQSVTFINDVAHVSFSDNIKEANVGSSGELMLTEQIALIAKQFGYDKTQILINDSIPETFLGHMIVDEPIKAGNPEDYEEMEY